MAINVTDAKGNQLYTINTDGSGNVTDVQKAATANAADLPFDPTQLTDILKGQKYSGDPSLEQLVANIGTMTRPADEVEDQKVSGKQLNALYEGLKKVKDQIESLEAKPKPLSADDAKQLKMLQAVEKLSLKELEGVMEHLQTFDPKKLTADTKAAMEKVEAAELLPDQPTPITKSKAQVTSSTGTPAQQGAAQAGAAPQPAYPGYGKASGAPGQSGNPFDLGAFLQSRMMETMNMNSFDQVGKSQAEQKKMMMLFMYFAMMAMSGDIGAMTSFMQFITTIIQKDKASLNISMANKLIELEDANRKSVDILTNTISYDPNNPQVANDFAKVMERVKADQGSIATSQKLIAQMMEDFAQVSEFLNNLQKSLLDVRGRLLSRLSTFNA